MIRARSARTQELVGSGLVASGLVGLGLVGLFVGSGCAPASEAERPVPALSRADRTPDPSCSASWVAALTVRVVDEEGRALPGARVAPCTTSGDGVSTCLLPIDADAEGWVVWNVEPSMRCLARVALRGLSSDAQRATTYVALPMRPVNGVLDVEDDLVIVATEDAIERERLGDASAPHALRFRGDVSLTVRPDALDEPEAYERIGLGTLDPADAPASVLEVGDTSLVLALSPDSELVEPAMLSMPAPDGAPDGTAFEAHVVGGLYTTLADGRVVEEGALASFARASVSGGRLVLPGLPRLGWIVITRVR